MATLERTGIPPEIGCYISVLSGLPVSTDILERFDDGTPLNRMEQETFDFCERNPKFLDALIGKVNRDMVTGMVATIGLYLEQLRNDPSIDTDSEDYKLNDHMRPYFSRMINSAAGGPVFENRRVSGETVFCRDEVGNPAENATVTMMLNIHDAARAMGSPILAAAIEALVCDETLIGRVHDEQEARLNTHD